MSPSALDRRSGFLAFFFGGTRVAIASPSRWGGINVIEGAMKVGSARFPSATGGRAGREGRQGRGWRTEVRASAGEVRVEKLQALGV